MKCLIFCCGLMRLFPIFKQWWTIKTQFWKQIGIAVICDGIKMTIMGAMGHYLTGQKITTDIKQFSGDIWGRKKKMSVAAADPRNKADILGWKQFDQLKPRRALCHVQKSPKMHAKVLNIHHKVTGLCNSSALVSKYSEEKRWVPIFEELRLVNEWN